MSTPRHGPVKTVGSLSTNQRTCEKKIEIHSLQSYPTWKWDDIKAMEKSSSLSRHGYSSTSFIYCLCPKNADNIDKKLQTCHYLSTDMHFRVESCCFFFTCGPIFRVEARLLTSSLNTIFPCISGKCYGQISTFL